MADQTIYKQLDEEWMNLIKEAKHLGLSIVEIKQFIEKNEAGDHSRHEYR